MRHFEGGVSLLNARHLHPLEYHNLMVDSSSYNTTPIDKVPDAKFHSALTRCSTNSPGSATLSTLSFPVSPENEMSIYAGSISEALDVPGSP